MTRTYQIFAASDRLFEAFDELKEKLDTGGEAEDVPDDLEAQVQAKLKENPDITWHRAVRLIVDPDATPDDDDEGHGDADDLDDEDES